MEDSLQPMRMRKVLGGAPTPPSATASAAGVAPNATAGEPMAAGRDGMHGILQAIAHLRDENPKRAYQYFKFVVRLINSFVAVGVRTPAHY